MTIPELEEWFKTAPKPEMPVYLNAATKVNDYERFLESHFHALKKNPESKLNVPVIIRLEQMKLIIEANL